MMSSNRLELCYCGHEAGEHICYPMRADTETDVSVSDHPSVASYPTHNPETLWCPDCPLCNADDPENELPEIISLLRQAGFDPACALEILNDGIGPYELEDRLKIPSGQIGSLEYTHNIHRIKKA